MGRTESIVTVAEDLAERLLFPAALETDAADIVPLSNLDALAEAGLYGIAGPRQYGGQGADLATVCAAIEALAGGCLSTTFIWNQHNTPVRALTDSPNAALKEAWLPELCSGRKRSGIALGGLRAGPSQITARRVDGGWVMDGEVPYITGWGRIDVLFVAARTQSVEPEVVTALVPAETSAALEVARLRLIATNASSTVLAKLRGLRVPDESVIAVEPYASPPEHEGGGRPNGSLSLGVAHRCCTLIGPSPLDAELRETRRVLDEAGEHAQADARAAASELALRAAATLVVAQGSTSLFLDAQAQRLLREAAFLQVFGTRPATRRALLQRLGGLPDREL